MREAICSRCGSEHYLGMPCPPDATDPTQPRSESGEAGISPETRRALEVHACRTDDDSIYRSLTGREPGGAPASSAEEIAAELEEIADYAEFQDETCASLRRAAAWIRAAEKERDELRAANHKLHRRAQSAEAGLAKALDERYAKGERTLGRALANSAATMYLAERDAAVARADAMEKAIEWRPIVTAPRRTLVEVLMADGEIDVAEWRSERQCMLAATADGAGECGPGWVSEGAGFLPIDKPTHWRPRAALARPAKEGEKA